MDWSKIQKREYGTSNDCASHPLFRQMSLETITQSRERERCERWSERRDGDRLCLLQKNVSVFVFGIWIVVSAERIQQNLYDTRGRHTINATRTTTTLMKCHNGVLIESSYMQYAFERLSLECDVFCFRLTVMEATVRYFQTISFNTNTHAHIHT